MSIVMYDSVSGAAIPTTATLIAGYVDGSYGPNDPYGSGWSAAAWARYPHAYHVTITVAGTPGARVADCEPGAMTQSATARWAKSEIAAGRRPTVYADAWDWANGVDQALAAVGLRRVRDLDGWVADIGQSIIPAGFVARQYAQGVPGVNGLHVDLSVTDGVWPYAAPVPIPPPNPGDDVAISNDWLIRNCYRVVLHREVDPGGYTTWFNFLTAGGDAGEMWAAVQDSAEGVNVLAAERKALGLT